MKICFINCLKCWGGGEKWHLEHALYLKNKGHEVCLISYPDSPLLQRAQKAGLETQAFKISNLSFLNPFLKAKVKAFFKKKGFEVIIMNSSRDLKVMCPIAKETGVRKIIFRRGSDIPIKDSAMNRRLFGRYITDILANSEATKKSILQNNPDLFDKNKIKIIYNGIDSSYTEDSYTRVVNDRPVIGILGRLAPQKRHDLFLQVAAELKKRGVKCKMVIGGDGPLENELKSMAKSLDVEDYVYFQGFIDRPKAFMNSIDVFALTSEWEGFGYVLAEAMSIKKPIVAFGTSSNPELITDCVNGFLVDWPDVKAFADALEKLLNDSSLCNRLGEAGCRIVKERFDYEINTKEVEKFICS